MSNSRPLILPWLPHSAPSWILSKAENLASSSLQDGATKWHHSDETTHQPSHPPIFFSCEASLSSWILNHLLTHSSSILPRSPKLVSKQEMELSKQEMELSKQEMELFHPLPDLWSKNLFYKMIIIFTHEFKINFLNRKWNSPKRKWNYFSYFQASNQKTSFAKCFSFKPRSSELIFKTGNGIIQTGNGIIYPISRPLIKKLLLQSVSHLFQGV